jgi:hypothetical protein
MSVAWTLSLRKLYMVQCLSYCKSVTYNLNFETTSSVVFRDFEGMEQAESAPAAFAGTSIELVAVRPDELVDNSAQCTKPNERSVPG